VPRTVQIERAPSVTAWDLARNSDCWCGEEFRDLIHGMKYPLAQVVFLLASTIGSAQTLIEPTYLLRAETIVFDPYRGMSDVCVLVLPDGHYRLEKSYQSGAGSGTTWVYSGTLPEENMRQLQAVLRDSKFQAINTGPMEITMHAYKTDGGFVTGTMESMDALSVSIPREHAVQNFAFKDAEERKPHERDLKPFQKWLKDLQKRKVDADKKENRTNCPAPHVVYRMNLGEGEPPPEPPRP
jgi:hypothetical protein